MPNFTAQRLEEMAAEVFIAAGVPDGEARTVAQSLTLANLVGHDSHGIMRVPQYIQMIQQGTIVPGAPTEVVMDTPQLAAIDGHWNFGMVVARRAMEMAIHKAEEHGVAVVSVRQLNHIARVGEYPEMAALRGFVGLAMSNSHGAGQQVAPYGGTARKLAPNVIAAAFPTGREFPVLIDITTSTLPEGKVRLYLNRGEPLPPGSVIDDQGHPTTDPAAYYGPPPGALLPMGGYFAHKGYALTLMADIFAGAFSGAGCTREGATRAGNPLFLLVVDPARFRPLEDFEKEVSNLIDYVKDSPKVEGCDEILVPGEHGFQTKQRRLKEGIPVEDETWSQIVEVAEKLGIHFPEAEIYQVGPSKFLTQSMAESGHK